ncbi:MAG: hypothetical protein IT462_04440 [Planctomycetes bacterium]|nr:hypothetical protein [Planctomycetota bacterium]
MPDDPIKPADETPLDVEAALLALRRRDPRYTIDAYRFAFEGLEYTVREYLKLKEPRHVSGKELCEGMRRLALEQFGFMAHEVWSRWGIRETRDWGNIIFNLVDAKLLRKTDEDCVEDFANIYDVRKALADDFKF